MALVIGLGIAIPLLITLAVYFLTSRSNSEPELTVDDYMNVL